MPISYWQTWDNFKKLTKNKHSSLLWRRKTFFFLLFSCHFLTPGVNFTIILRAAFSYKSSMRSYYVLTIWVCNFFGKNILAQKLFIKCWWNWHLVPMDACEPLIYGSWVKYSATVLPRVGEGRKKVFKHFFFVIFSLSCHWQHVNPWSKVFKSSILPLHCLERE